jgi:tripartite-type tricarboxylate transporter receptor subunit TctC
MHKEGHLRVLAITGDKRDPMFPDISTMRESGYTELETYACASFFVRADTPGYIVSKLGAALAS